MELKDLVGGHLLTAVDFSTEQIKQYDWSDDLEDCMAVRFCLDGVNYVAIEDPEDGYRSSMKDLIIDDSVIPNQFPPQQVVCVHRLSSRHVECDILDIVDASTGKVILEVGTDNTDDYYPSFVSSFHPEAMAINN